ncbi:DUF2125 domain-containing protein [Mesorhizobium sp. LHD-90]|uniref:DUF2125 domain-containing protein n=1 Tax=Mesorhizobium sp. LHD-90 TaxID=3071414 RepID=UPI0027DF2BEB|nr:DUF2125 domain-containing protein [Mesorhizobium sp. LHD-90]MDQ6432652.1 DUF2125 domain-containing protein [Mesorhizobium sp. LHD-90]
MHEPSRPNGRYGRRIFWLGVVIAIVAGGYTAGWFWLARKIEAQTLATLARLEERGVKAECINPTARGYPFRIGLYCDRVAFARPAEALTVAAGAFRSAGQIYDPMRLVAELDSPATISAPGGQIALDWRALRASMRLTTALPERVSLEGSKLRLGMDERAQLVTADTFEAHMRPNEADLDVAGRFGGLVIDPSLVAGRNVPSLSGEADLSVKDGVALLAERGPLKLRGRSGIVRDLTLQLGDKGALKLSGPFSIDLDGLIDADLKVAISDPKALAVSLSQVFPEQEDKIKQGFAGLAFFGSKPSLPMRITKGEVTLSFIPLGKIKPVD